MRLLLVVGLAVGVICAEIEKIPAFAVTDEELLNVADKLRQNDDNKAKHGELDFNYQKRTTTRDNQDNANGKFFTKVDASLLRKPTYESFLKLIDNFNRDVGMKEPKVSLTEEKKETSTFIDLILETKPWKTLYSFLSSKGHPFTTSPTTWRYWIAQLWFVHYSRARGVPDTSGFEHIFIGEAKNGVISGLHNWVRLYSLERNANEQFDYKGYLVQRFNIMASLKFAWKSEMKSSGSLLLGTSPEFDMALYTLCFLSRRGRNTCDIELDGCPLQITSYDITQNGKVYIGSIFPSAGRITDKCRRMNSSH